MREGEGQNEEKQRQLQGSTNMQRQLQGSTYMQSVSLSRSPSLISNMQIAFLSSNDRCNVFASRQNALYITT